MNAHQNLFSAKQREALESSTERTQQHDQSNSNSITTIVAIPFTPFAYTSTQNTTTLYAIKNQYIMVSLDSNKRDCSSKIEAEGRSWIL